MLPGSPALGFPFPLVVTPAVVVPAPMPTRTPPTYAPGAILRDYLATPDGKDIDFGYPTGAVWAADEVAIAQQIRMRLSIQTGEIDSDLGMGVDWEQLVFGVGKTNTQILAAVRPVIQSVPGVKAVQSISSRVIGGAVVIDFVVTTDRNGIAAGQVSVVGGA